MIGATTMNAIFAFLHHITAFLLFSVLIVEMVLLKGALDQERLRQLQKADLIYGLTAGLVLVLGLLRVFYFEKGSGYYFHNAYFLTKVGLFAIIGLLSVYPTVKFIQWGKSLKRGAAPVITDHQRLQLLRVMTAELAGLGGMMFCAAMMARGYGML